MVADAEICASNPPVGAQDDDIEDAVGVGAPLPVETEREPLTGSVLAQKKYGRWNYNSVTLYLDMTFFLKFVSLSLLCLQRGAGACTTRGGVEAKNG